MDKSLDFDKVLEWLYHKNYIMSTTNVAKVLINRKYLKFESTFPGINQRFDNHTPFLKYNKRSLIKIFTNSYLKKAGVHAYYPLPLDNRSSHRT